MKTFTLQNKHILNERRGSSRKLVFEHTLQEAGFYSMRKIYSLISCEVNEKELVCVTEAEKESAAQLIDEDDSFLCQVGTQFR